MPTADPDRLDAVEVARRLGGSASWGDLLRWSTSHSVRRALATGALRRTSRGTYALPETPPARQAAHAMRGLLSHESAAAYWRLEPLSPATQVHVTVPRGARPQPIKGVALHYSDVDPADEREGVTSPLRTVLDCAATMPLRNALAIADSALRLGLIDGDQLVDAAVRRSGRGRRSMLRVAGAADARAANAFESGLRAILLDAGLTGFEPQLLVVTGELNAYVDLGDARRRVALEADSFAYHGTREALERDCRRYDELTSHGWLVLRFAWEHVMFDPRWVMTAVRNTCALRDLRNPTQQRPFDNDDEGDGGHLC